MLRPTLAGRTGRDNGYGPGVGAPFGTSPNYVGVHHGQDYFWLYADPEASKQVLACINGPAYRVYDQQLGYGWWQQLNSDTRIFYWHLVTYSADDGVPATTSTVLGIMGHTGTAAGDSDHLHFEVRKAPYRSLDRVDPAPYFTLAAGEGGTPFPIPEEDEGSDMYAVVQATKDGVRINDWSRVGSSVLPVVDANGKVLFPGGFEATANINLARFWRWSEMEDGSDALDFETEYKPFQQWGAGEYVKREKHEEDRLRRMLGGGTPGTPGTPADVAAIAAASADATALKLAPSFAGIPKAVLDAQAKRLES